MVARGQWGEEKWGKKSGEYKKKRILIGPIAIRDILSNINTM